MVSKSELIRKLRRSIGDQVYRLIDESFVNEVLFDESLRVFSDYYPLLVAIQIQQKDAIPYKDYTGRNYNYMYYRIPDIYTMGSMGNSDEKFVWRDIENFYIVGNDSSDVYSGGNFILNSFFLNARSYMPHTRSYYMVNFEEPDILVLDPPQVAHRNFTVRMQANRTLKTIPRNMQTLFMELFVCDMKIAIYNKFRYEVGQQVYGGIEIDTKIDEFKDAESDRKELIETFEKDWHLNPERMEVITLYQSK